MLFRNDIFVLNDVRFRLLYADPGSMLAWAIVLDTEKGVPLQFDYATLQHLSTAVPLKDATAPRPPSTAMLASQRRAMGIIGNLPSKVPEIYNASSRGKLIAAHSAASGHSPKAIYKNLRRFWVGGQVPSALLAQFGKCGLQSSLTQNRGPKTERGVYQLTKQDHEIFHEAIFTYLKDERKTVEHVFLEMLRKHYTHAGDFNGVTLFPLGERPTIRQFRHFLDRNYTFEKRLRNRKGDANFNREDRAVLGTIMDDCVGVAHYYECDATVGDVLLVAESDPSQIVGKPTIYFIVDRRSRLIVGFYVGLENASWVCALQAAFSIAQDKRLLCEQYGVRYDPADWPAHELYPKQMLFDHGEGFSEASNRLAENMAVTVANPPALRADWKPIVESRFKMVRQRLQGGVYGFVSPEDAKKRRNKTGVSEKEACLTLKEFSAIMLNLIISHNKTPITNYAWGPGEMRTEMVPSPINIWNYDISARSGFACRYSEDFVRMALLPKKTGEITRRGVVFNGIYYASRDAVAIGLFVRAGSGTIPVQITFDSRLVDSIYMHHPDGSGVTFECRITSMSERYRGLSLAEALTLQGVEKSFESGFQHLRDQEKISFNEAVESIQTKAKKRLTEAGITKTRSSRKADVKASRAKERTTERKRVVKPVDNRDDAASRGKVIALRAPSRISKTGPSTPSPVTPPRTGMQDLLQRAREKMKTQNEPK